MKRTILAAVMAALTGACGHFPWENPVSGPSQNQDVDVNVNIGQPAPAPSPSASPNSAGPIVRLKITFFTDNGNGDKTLVVGQKGTITATPLDANGVDPCKGVENCPVYGQSDIRWIVPAPGVAEDACDANAIIAASAVEEERFNQDLLACNSGTFTISAIFKESVPGALTGTVVPPAK